MDGLQLLFKLSVEHTYFSDLTCASLRFVPTKLSVSLLNKTGLFLKPFKGGIAVFCEADQLDILKLHAADFDDGLKLTFKIFSEDIYFSYYTDFARNNNEGVFYFDNKSVVQDSTGRQRLHHGDYVSDQACQAITSDHLREVFDRRDYLVKPDLVVQIGMTIGKQDLCSRQLDMRLRHFYIRFATNKSFWKYYILGELAKRKIYIADLDNRVEFEEIGEVLLVDRRPAIMLQSTSAISMQAVQEQRFQLREQGTMGDKTLIKRMPNAGVGRVSEAVIKGKMEVVSEIYIN